MKMVLQIFHVNTYRIHSIDLQLNSDKIYQYYSGPQYENEFALFAEKAKFENYSTMFFSFFLSYVEA